MPVLTVSDLKKDYGSFEAVRRISFSIEEGQCVSLLGPNGAGKTTTLKMLAGLIRPTSGLIELAGAGGQDVRQHIGYLPQMPSFHEWMSGREFLVYVAELAGMSSKDAKESSREMLDMVGLEKAAARKIGGYSGGMKQRLGIAQALIHRPKLVIMDEPVSALDPIGRHEILQLMHTIRSQTTILYSTHVLHDAEEVSDSLLILVQGKIVVDGSIDTLRSQYQESVVQVEAESTLEKWRDSFQQLAVVTDVSIEGEKASLTVSDMNAARQQLFQIIAKDNIRVQRLEFGHSSLEDLFLKVVTE